MDTTRLHPQRWRLAGRRLALVAGALGTTALLTAASTFGLFSASAGSQTNQFTAGTVTLGSSALATCTITNMAPGDSSQGWAGSPAGNHQDPTCVDKITYTGSLSAWVWIDVTVTSPNPAAPGTPALWDGTPSGLQLDIADGNRVYQPNTTHQLLSAVPVRNGFTDTIDVNYLLPLLAPDSYQRGTAVVTIAAEAVQARNNTQPLAAGNFTFNPPTPPSDSFLFQFAPLAVGGWQVTSGSVDVDGAQVIAPVTGTNDSLDLNGVGPGVISQTIPTQAGHTYNVSFYMSGNPACGSTGVNATKSLAFSWNGTTVDVLSIDQAPVTTANMRWMYHSYVLTATSSSTPITFTSTTPYTSCGPELGGIEVTSTGSPYGPIQWN